MRIETIKKEIFDYNDIIKNEELREKVLEKNYDIALHEYWYEFVYDDWKEKLNKLGYDDCKINFSGFWSQGDGASFTCSSVDNDILVNRLIRTRFNLNSVIIDNCTIEIKRYDHIYVHENTISCNIDYYQLSNYDLIDNYLNSIINDLEHIITVEVRDISLEIYRDLEIEYDRLVSAETILEMIQSNNYEFYSDGTMI